MRTSIVKVAAIFFLLATANIFAADLSSHEQTCADLGFKKRTPAYGIFQASCRLNGCGQAAFFGFSG